VKNYGNNTLYRPAIFAQKMTGGTHKQTKTQMARRHLGSRKKAFGSHSKFSCSDALYSGDTMFAAAFSRHKTGLNLLAISPALAPLKGDIGFFMWEASIILWTHSSK
jgi:hypothetical protein